MGSDTHLNPDVEVIDRVVIYDTQTGEIVGSHTLAAAGKLTDAMRQRFESSIRRDTEEMEKRHNRKLAIHRSPELNRLTSLHHRVDVATGKLVEHGTHPVRVKVV
jgi:hypothetical protein